MSAFPSQQTTGKMSKTIESTNISESFQRKWKIHPENTRL